MEFDHHTYFEEDIDYNLVEASVVDFVEDIDYNFEVVVASVLGFEVEIDYNFVVVEAFVDRFLLGKEYMRGNVGIAPMFEGKVDLERWIKW